MSSYSNSGFGDIVGIPTTAVNGFLWDTMKDINSNLGIFYGDINPFYPITDAAAGDQPWDNKPYFIYDRVFRFNEKPFYENKKESILYYLKAKEIDSLEWSAVVQAILDRGDDAAQDVNNWIRSQEEPEKYPFYFHNIRVYQSRSSSPSSAEKLREVSTLQSFYITEFMVDIHYHHTNQLLRRKKSGGGPSDFEYSYKKKVDDPDYIVPGEYT